MGAITASLQRRVAEDLDTHVQDLLSEGLALWRDQGWHRFDDEEENCTVQVYRWCREVTRRNARYALLTVHLEWVNLTPEILSGLASVKTASRPDLRIEVDVSGRAVECKRLAVAGPWIRRYVYDGVARFVTGDYGHGEGSGFMVGYTHETDLPDLVDRINGHIVRHPAMGAGQELDIAEETIPVLWGRSRHLRGLSGSATDIHLTHVLVTIVEQRAPRRAHD